VHRLVAGRAGVAGLDAGELPDDPVGRLDQPVGPAVDLGRLVEDLQRLAEEPLARDLAAVARQPRLARRRAVSLMRSACGWAAWCFQSFTQACGSSRRSGSRQSGVPSRRVGSIVQAVKSMAMPTTSAGPRRRVRSTAGTVRFRTST
jgi:hypothetical protein